ncbi:MAG: hypothetical protein VX447_00390 [Pseudomonadota bacterium]|uniref:lipid-binding SYLF domain-containing protein n=1 Tax=Gallaecimonas pentaromativorans TaxID=584787 RepID=UPI00067EA98E|nr:hypothetical protein [Gallaecimonas pentaromativorans]MED5523200.1 hypothetical protein [Pseudomonadota bacterium]
MALRTLTAPLGLALLLSACTSTGDTPAEKRQAVLQMQQQTLARLYAKHPGARTKIANAYGYGVFDLANQNLILLSTSGGYGVLTDQAGHHTYMRMGGGGIGFGLGIKDYSEVVIFKHKADFERFRDFGWDASAQAEATAKANDSGGDVAANQSVDLDVTTYQLTESGIALQATIGAAKYWRWDELN